MKIKEDLRPSCTNAMHGMMLKDLQVKPFPDEKQFDVCVTEVVSPYMIYAQLLSDDSVEALQLVSQQLQEQYSNPTLQVFTPKLYEICVAKFPEDGLWYRAIVIQYNTDMTARVCLDSFKKLSLEIVWLSLITC